MNKEQKKFKDVIKKRRRSQRKKAVAERQKVFARLAPSDKARIRYELRHKKNDKKKKREEVQKEIGMTNVTSTKQ